MCETSHLSNTSERRLDPDGLVSFHTHLKSSTHVLTLVGAGLSASSGLPTFRGTGGLWRTYDSASLATPEAFSSNPGLVWQFYSYRRHASLQVQPNAAHFALAKMARRLPGSLTLSQNVDGLSERVDHPTNQLVLLHGTLFKVRCIDQQGCGYSRIDHEDPIIPALAIPENGERHDNTVPSSAHPLPDLQPKSLPTCPNCNNLLRPGVVWFGERLPQNVHTRIAEWFNMPSKVDLVMVIGTSAQVYPAAGYINVARSKGARVCVVNTEDNDGHHSGLQAADWFFKGDAALIIPKLLEPLVGS
ncbi:NAD-dependent deacetylase-like protein sirtuin-5 [Polychaeton citri CBS 116435]|uniref:NAD-dependent deacetylase-like protein sirtuin-5 n=1 Tax=Polychaeton citri CBS 116435 TaxID=1314669 RepID=A0A9P4UNT7_9PEZI|nr:NAD-dependent deacetylase-like protein sirtuin-5 [Polychaeton citri CBS 116435]